MTNQASQTPLNADTPVNTHTAFKELSLVDISPLFCADESQHMVVARELDKAARECGFLYVTGHGISRERRETLKACAEAYFAQPEADKMGQYIGKSENHSGYVPMGEEQFYGGKVDAKEAYDISFEVTDPAKKSIVLGENLWPELDGFREGVQPYYDEALNVGTKLFEGFALGLGLPRDTFTQHLSSPPSQLRFIHYFFNPDAVDQPGIGAHTDYEFFTILLPTSPGLQVLNGAGEWIDVPVIPDAFVVNIGDMMEIASNGRYIATSHRVKKVSAERYSFPLFCNLDYDTVVQPLEALCQDEPPRYEPVVCGDHLAAQTIQTFKYLQKRLESGEITLPEQAKDLSSFGHASLKESALKDESPRG